MRYIIYTRVSTNKQTVENQLHECRNHVKSLFKKGDELIEFEEPDTSTRKPISKRPKLMAMMQALQPEDTLILYKVDRLARQPRELMNIYFDIRDKNVKIQGIKDSYVDDQNICIYAFIACTERENIKVRTISGLDRKRANMEKVGGAAAYGYSVDPTKLSPYKDAKSEGKPYLLVPNEEEQKHLAVMMECYDNGLSYGDIARELEKRNFKNRQGNRICKSTVYRIMKRIKKYQSPKDLVAV